MEKELWRWDLNWTFQWDTPEVVLLSLGMTVEQWQEVMGSWAGRRTGRVNLRHSCLQ